MCTQCRLDESVKILKEVLTNLNFGQKNLFKAGSRKGTFWFQNRNCWPSLSVAVGIKEGGAAGSAAVP